MASPGEIAQRLQQAAATKAFKQQQMLAKRNVDNLAFLRFHNPGYQIPTTIHPVNRAANRIVRPVVPKTAIQNAMDTGFMKNNPLKRILGGG